jgi:hypothetical protein
MFTGTSSLTRLSRLARSGYFDGLMRVVKVGRVRVQLVWRRCYHDVEKAEDHGQERPLNSSRPLDLLGLTGVRICRSAGAGPPPPS